MRKLLVDAGVPVLVFLAMVVVGMELTADDFRRVARHTVAMIFVARNIGIATAIAVSVLGRVEFAVFATAYFLVQAPFLVAAVVLFRRVRVGRGINLVGADPS